MHRQLPAKYRRRYTEAESERDGGGGERGKKGKRERERHQRISVRGERMKFTELHIAVVTFHP